MTTVSDEISAEFGVCVLLESFSSHTGSALGQDCGACEPRTSVTENLLIRQRQGERCCQHVSMLST